MTFSIGDELRIPLGQQRRTVLAVCEGRAQFDVSTGGYVAVKWYTFAELRALNGVPFTAADAWEGASGSTPPASEDANAYPRPVRVAVLQTPASWGVDWLNAGAVIRHAANGSAIDPEASVRNALERAIFEAHSIKNACPGGERDIDWLVESRVSEALTLLLEAREHIGERASKVLDNPYSTRVNRAVYLVESCDKLLRPDVYKVKRSAAA